MTMAENNHALALGIQSVADAVGVSPGFIRSEIQKGHLVPTRLGRRVVIRAAEVERYLKSNTEEN